MPITCRALRITPLEREPFRITPLEREPFRITPLEREPFRITPLKREPFRITPLEREPFRRAKTLVCVLLVLAVPAPAVAQSSEPSLLERRPPRFSVKPTDVEVLLACQAVAHFADVFTTGYDLSIGGAYEGNPVLRPFTHHPVRLAAVVTGINILQTYTIAKLQHGHPGLARWWALALVATEVWATINNINGAGELQRARTLRQ